MPYSSTPTYIGNGQSLKIRYNSPPTWDTELNPTIQIQIGNTTGEWRLGNRKPRTTVKTFNFLDDTVRETVNGAEIAGDDVNGYPLYIEKNTEYYSNVVTLSGLSNLALDYLVPITISTTDSGGSISGYGAQFRVKAPGGSWGSWRTTAATVKENYQVQLRMTTANAYTTTRTITVKVGFDGDPSGQGEWPWNSGANAVDSAYDNYTVSEVWSLQTRQQDVVVDQFTFNDLGFTNTGAVLESEYVTAINSYVYEDLTLTGIDDDAVMRARVKNGKTKFSNQTEANLSGIEYFALAPKTSNSPPIETSSEWKTELTNLALNDSVWVRLKAGNYTTQRRVDVEVYAIVADGNNTSGTVEDEWKVRTETDKYPDAYVIGPLYAVSDGDNVQVSSTSSITDAEPGFNYYGQVTFSGFGVEYDGTTVVASGTCTGSLETFDATSTTGTNFIRTYTSDAKNVTNGTKFYFRIQANSNFSSDRNGTFTVNGISNTMTVNTRPAKVIPYPWTFYDRFWPATGGLSTTITTIRGLEAATNATIIDQNVVNAQISRDGINWGSSINNIVNGDNLRCRISNPSSYGVLNADGEPNFTFATVRIGGSSGTSETYHVYPSDSNDVRDYEDAPGIYEFEVPDFAPTIFFDMSGAGGGSGGDDAPNSYGGPGGIGIRLKGTIENVVAGTIIQFIVPGKGSNGTDFTAGASGGAGGSGYLVGGQGGNAGTGDKSGGGGGGGGAACIRIKGGDIIAIAGGGGGGAGAGNDTRPPTEAQYGNYNASGNYSPGSLSTNLANFLAGATGSSVSAGGQGGGGGGGGAGNSTGGAAGTGDIDAKAGTGGGAYYNTNYFSTAPTISTTTGAPAEGDGYIAYSHPQQDITPEPVPVFNSLTNLEFSTVYESNKQLIQGITGATNVTASGGNAEVRALDENGDPLPGNGSDWASTVNIGNNQQIQVRATSSPSPNIMITVSVIVGSATVYWNLTTRQPDDTEPFDFDIPAKLNQNLDVPVYSDELTVQGINVGVTASVDSGEFRTCNLAGQCTAYDSSDKQVFNGYTIKLKKQSAPGYNAPVYQYLTVGDGNAAEFLVKTKEEPDQTPNSFVFDNETVAPGTTLTSKVSGTDQFYVGGYSGSAAISIDESPADAVSASDVEIYVDDVVTASGGSIANGSKLYLKFTTPSSAGTVSKIYLIVGTYNVPAWEITNTGIQGTDPDAILFPTVNATAAGALTYSAQQTVSGLNAGVSIDLYATGGAQISINGGTTWLTATASSPIQVSNDDTIELRLTSNEIEGQLKQTNVFLGNYETTWTVVTPFFTPPEPKRSKWYSEFTERLGLPIGSVVAVFKDATTTDNYGFGSLTGKLNSRFHGWIECNGEEVDTADYPQLWESIGNTYGGNGSKTGGGVYSGSFNLPDFRNRKVLGTGAVDGNTGGSPSVVTLYGPDGVGNGGSTIAGSQGGYWFIDTIDDPAVVPIEQVIDGDPPIESAYFNIGQIVTTGYSNVTGSIEFQVPSSEVPGEEGNTTNTITLKELKLFEVPYHQHEVISAALDPGESTGSIPWNGAGARTSTIGIEFGGFLNLVPQPPPNEPIDYWGWPINDVTVTPFATSIAPGDEINDSGDTTWDGGGVGEVNTYVTLPSGKRYLGSLSPFATLGTLKTYKSSTGTARKHSHYLSLTDVTDQLTQYSYGNNEGVGTAYPGLPSGYGESISVLFSAEELGLEIFPGEFTLNSTTQIIPEPALSPQSKVPLVTPYTRVKWVIRAF